MAKATTKNLSADVTYQVVLNRSIKVGRSYVHPGPNVKLSGEVLEAVLASDADAVDSYEPAKTVGE